MWTRTYSTITKKVTGEQIWKLFADVNNWHKGIEYAKMEGKFEKGNHFLLKPKGGPKVKIELVETKKNKRFVDITYFPLAQMYDEHLFEETKDGLKITYTISVKGLLAFLWVKIVAQNIVNDLPEDTKRQIAAASKL